MKKGIILYILELFGNELVVEGETIYSVKEKMMLQEILEKLGVVVPFV